MAPTHHAIVIKGPGEAVIEEVSVPNLPPAYLLIQTAAIAINPTDFKHISYMATKNTRVGCDFSGTVLEVGSAVTKPFKKGDRVTGFTHGSNAQKLDYGCFGDIIIAKADVSIVIPENLSFEEAATLGIGIGTVGQSLYQSLKLPLPPAEAENPPKDILIYGGSSATGSLAIQYAKLSGYRVITTCSERNFDLVKSLGADEVFDYNSDSCMEDIKKTTNGKLAHVLDCISSSSSIKISVSAMAAEGGVYSTLNPVDPKDVKAINDKVEAKFTLVYTMLGEEIRLGPKSFPASKEDLDFGRDFWELSRGFLESGKVKVHKISVNEGGKGLEGALYGIDLLRKGQVSGKKLVYTL